MSALLLALQFTLCAGLIARAGWVLSHSGERIAALTGLSGGYTPASGAPRKVARRPAVRPTAAPARGLIVTEGDRKTVVNVPTERPGS